MYEKDKKTRLTLRLNDAQFAWVKASADMLDTSPSDFLRMVINSTMTVAQSNLDSPETIQSTFEDMEVLRRANEVANKYH